MSKVVRDITASHDGFIAAPSDMNSSNILSRQGHRMLQIGIALFVFSGLEGFAIPHLPVRLC